VFFHTGIILFHPEQINPFLNTFTVENGVDFSNGPNSTIWGTATIARAIYINLK
jgi:hypothetical protein